ncbi:MAG: hypothetical protein E7007_03270 [Alphaproteobacteria bacterium]|nr:hypothetical protein [Alphaproteobacteria bacterium]
MKNNKKHLRQTLDNFNQEQIAADRKKVENIGKCKKSAMRILDEFCKSPKLDITTLVQKTGLTRPTVTNTIKKLEGIGIISAINHNKKWGQCYKYDALVGSLGDFENNTTRTQNKNGLFLQFNGRDFADKLSDTPSTKRFKPYKYHNEKLANRNSSNRLYIGDNLDGMKAMMSKYQETVDLAYFDIPYNMPSTRLKQAYSDSFDGTCDLLCMLLPRLKLVQKLLSSTGLLALSVSEHEVAYVKLLMDEVFGRENIVNNIVIEMAIPAGLVSGYTQYKLPSTKGYLLVYAKDKSQVNYLQRLYDPADDKFTSGFNIVLDEKLNKTPLIDFLKQQPDIVQRFKSHKLAIKNENIAKLMDYDTDFENYMYQTLSKNLYKRTKPYQNPVKSDFNAPVGVVFEYDGKLLEKTQDGTVYHLKPFYNKLQTDDNGVLANSVIRGDIWKGYYSEKSRIQKEGGVPFSAGKKPVKLIRDLLKWIGKKNVVVLDAFAGSATTAEAVIVQNKLDGGTRSFILCQLPEEVQAGSIEAKAGFKFIHQITIQRLKNVTKAINNDDGFQIYV